MSVGGGGVVRRWIILERQAWASFSLTSRGGGLVGGLSVGEGEGGRTI